MVAHNNRKDRKRERNGGGAMAGENGKATSEAPGPEPGFVLDLGLPGSHLEVGREN